MEVEPGSESDASIESPTPSSPKDEKEKTSTKMMSSEEFRTILTSRAPTITTTSKLCQKCNERGHWTYDCKAPRPKVVFRDSRTKILKNRLKADPSGKITLLDILPAEESASKKRPNSSSSEDSSDEKRKKKLKKMKKDKKRKAKKEKKLKRKEKKKRRKTESSDSD